MRANAILLTSILILYSTISFSPVVRAQWDQPQWSIGDYWVYSSRLVINMTAIDILVRQEVEERTPLTINDTTYDTYRCRMTLMFAQEPHNMIAYGEKYVQLSTLSPVRTETTMYGKNTTYTYQPPHERYLFPLSNGQTWSSTSFVTGMVNGNTTNFTWTVEVIVSGPETIVVPAGTFEVFNVSARTMEPGSVGWPAFYSQEIGNEVWAWGSFLGTFEFPFLMELDSYNYQQGREETFTLFLIGIIVVAAIVAIGALYLWYIGKKKSS